MIHIYSFNKDKLIVISDKEKDKITKKYGYRYEIINSFKDKQSILHYRMKLEKQSPTFNIIEDYFVKKFHSQESKLKMSQSKIGTKRPDKVKAKISESRKGVGNFSGKKQVEGKKLIYNPSTDTEKRVVDIINLPDGFRKGRDPEVIDTMLYGLSRSRNSK